VKACGFANGTRTMLRLALRLPCGIASGTSGLALPKACAARLVTDPHERSKPKLLAALHRWADAVIPTSLSTSRKTSFLTIARRPLPLFSSHLDFS